MIAVPDAGYLGLEYLANKLLVCYILIDRYGGGGEHENRSNLDRMEQRPRPEAHLAPWREDGPP